MSGNIPGTGEIWVLKDNSGVKRDCLVLNSAPDGYTMGWLLHSYSKGADNILVKMVRGERYVDPRKLSYWHTATFQTMVAQIKVDDYIRIKSKAATLLGLGVQSKELETRCATAEANVSSMGKKIAELTIERDLYKGLCEKALTDKPLITTATEQGEKQGEDPAEKKLARYERIKITRTKNREKYLPKQAYIEVKRKTLKMSFVTIGLIIGYSAHAVGDWAKGNAPADWEALEKLFPGIEVEADKWAKAQKKEE